MKRFTQKIDNLFAAITFAEAGEFKTAREYMREEDRPRQSVRVIPSVRPTVQLRASGLRRK